MEVDQLHISSDELGINNALIANMVLKRHLVDLVINLKLPHDLCEHLFILLLNGRLIFDELLQVLRRLKAVFLNQRNPSLL
jgi:hypothetical protein